MKRNEGLFRVTFLGLLCNSVAGDLNLNQLINQVKNLVTKENCEHVKAGKYSGTNIEYFIICLTMVYLK